MQDAAFERIRLEADTWVKRGRRRLLAHLVRRYAPRTQGLRILEIGAGLGGNVPTLSAFGEVDVEEIHPGALAALRERTDLRRIFEQPLPLQTDERWDLIVAVEVLEHLEEDHAAVAWCLDHLAPGGILVITVPNHPWLYGDHDRAVGHVRRYSPARLADTLPPGARLLDSGRYLAAQMPVVLAARAGWQLARSLRSGGPARQKGLEPGLLDSAAGWILNCEIALVGRGLPMPFGHGLFAVFATGP